MKRKIDLFDKEVEDKVRVKAEEDARMESERKAQSIAQQIQDKSKMELKGRLSR